MYLKSLKVRNFKNLLNFECEFRDYITTIVGENGAGKTNLFDVIRLLFDKYYHSRLSENTFSSFLDNCKGHWIILSAVLSEIGDTAEEAVILKDENNEGIINLILRPNKYIRKNLYELSQVLLNETDENRKNKKKKEIDVILNDIDLKYDYEEFYSQTSILNFLIDEEYERVVGDFNNYIFPNPDVEDAIDIGNQLISNDLYSLTNVTYIPAIRNVNQEFSKENNILSRLVTKVSEEITKEEWNKIVNNITEINEDLNTISSLQDFSKQLNEQVNRTIGNIYTENLGYKIQLSDKMTDVLKNFELVGQDSNKELAIYSRSLGDNNITYFALKLLESSYLLDNSKRLLNILLIEEPEAHIHKHLQKSLFAGVKDIKGNQIFLSTHSVHISESSNISSVVVLGKSDRGIRRYSPSNKLTNDVIRNIERYLDANRIPLLFSKNILLVEGTAELILIPIILKNLYDIDLDKYGISIISVDSTFFNPLALLFHKDRIQRKCAIITDGDLDYSKKGEYKTKEEKAIKRVNQLKDDFKEDDFVEIFTSKYTFEIDLFKDNFNIFLNFVKDSKYYKRDYDKFHFISNSDFPFSYYNAIMKICDKIGKGWLALDFANYFENQIDELQKFKVPTYITDALFFLLTNSHVSMDNIKLIVNKYCKTFNIDIEKEEIYDNFIMSLKEYMDGK